jgi:hypothetical protein
MMVDVNVLGKKLFHCSWGPLLRSTLNGIMNFTQYQDIFVKNLVASARRLKLGRNWIFQQDNNKSYGGSVSSLV